MYKKLPHQKDKVSYQTIMFSVFLSGFIAGRSDSTVQYNT